MSSAIAAKPVSVRPRTTCAEMRICGPWQMTNIGFFAASKSLTNRCTSLFVRNVIRRHAAGNQQCVEVVGGHVGDDLFGLDALTFVETLLPTYFLE